MRAAIRSVLAVYERVEAFAVAAVGVRETELECLAGVMERRINGLTPIGFEVFEHQVQKAVARLKGLAIEDQLQPGIQVAVMAQAALDVLGAKIDFLKYFRVRDKLNQGSIGFTGSLSLL